MAEYRNGKRLVALVLLGLLMADGAFAAAGDSRFAVVARGVLRDGDTGLQWTERDNRFDLNWSDAKAYCDGLALAGGGWRLPSSAELQEIYDPTLPGVECNASSKCKVSSLFHLTSYWFWSGTKEDGSARAWFVDLLDGVRRALGVSYSGSLRALCVRRP